MFKQTMGMLKADNKKEGILVITELTFNTNN